MISALAVRFAKVSVHDIDQAIMDSLKLVGESLGVDQSFLGRFYENGKEGRVTHCWKALSSQHKPHPTLTEKDHPQEVSMLFQGKPAIEKSMLTIPLFQGPRCVGYFSLIVFDRQMHWPLSLIDKLQAVVNVIGSALARVRTEETLQQQQDEQAELRFALYRASRISAMGGMTAALAHEINQPMAAILTNAQTLQRYLNTPNPSMDEFRDIAADIISDVKRARDVMMKLRSLFQKEKQDFSQLDLNATITELYPVMQSELLLKEVEFKDELAPDLPPVRGDRIQIQQVVLNLIFNGMEAMKNSKPRHLHLSTKLLGPQIQVKVSDSGPGIPKKVLPNVFEPFFTTKDKGMGMGLSINKAIVTAHGGHIAAENGPERGATFTFTLPALVNA